MMLQEIFVCRFSGTVDWTWWTNSMVRSFLWFKSLTFLSQGDIWSLMFVLQKSVTSRTCNNEYRMDLRCFVLHLELSNEQTVTLQNCTVVRWRSMWTFWASSSRRWTLFSCWKFWPSQRPPSSISLNLGRKLSSFWSLFGKCPVWCYPPICT